MIATGHAARYQPWIMGEYTKESYQHNGKPVFKHNKGTYFLYFEGNKGWLVRIHHYEALKYQRRYTFKHITLKLYAHYKTMDNFLYRLALQWDLRKSNPSTDAILIHRRLHPAKMDGSILEVVIVKTKLKSSVVKVIFYILPNAKVFQYNNYIY